ncbi:MAG TPA: hypothetical protein VMD59_04295, partial [Acidimicrobiales bacterium]|nr:hypothetical protein [Acidimicrobiales bacterium]
MRGATGRSTAPGPRLLLAVALAAGVAVPLLTPGDVASAAADVAWSAMLAPIPATSPVSSSVQAGGVQLEAASCTGASFCVAAGSYEEEWIPSSPPGYYLNAGFGLLEVWSDDSWSAFTAPEPVTSPAGNEPGYTATTAYPYPAAAAIDSASCVSPTSCLAVGWYEDSAEDTWGLVERWDGSTWSPLAVGAPADDPLGAVGTVTGVSLNAVSCASPTSCVAVGQFDDENGQWALIDTLSGTTWTLSLAAEPATDQAGTAPSYDAEPSGSVAETASLDAVSCVSAGCVAVGSYDDTHGAAWGLLESLSSGSWTAAAAPEPLTDAAGKGPGYESEPTDEESASLDSVSCATASSCSAVGQYQDTAGRTWGLLLT